MSEPECPYKGLDSFKAEDAAYFHGRAEETQEIADSLLSRTVTTLYGPSGVGKTSLLQIALPDRIRAVAEDCRLVFWGSHDPSLDCPQERWEPGFLLNLLRKTVDCLKPAEGESLDSLAAVWSSRHRGPVAFVFDQFEDYFVYHPSEGGEERVFFETQLARLAYRRDVNARLLFAIREDAFARLSDLGLSLPEVMVGVLRLHGLTIEGAREAIEKPLKVYNRRHRSGQPPIELEPQLVERVLAESVPLRKRRATGSQTEGGDGLSSVSRVEPAYLQLMLTKLWEKERGTGSQILRVRTFDVELGGAKGIVHRHVAEAVEQLTPGKQDRCAEMLIKMIAFSGRKIPFSAAELAGDLRCTQEEVQELLEHLAEPQRRILRSVPAPEHEEGPWYEPFHDLLAGPLRNWASAHKLRRDQTYEARLRFNEAKIALEKGNARVAVLNTLVAYDLAAQSGAVWLAALDIRGLLDRALHCPIEQQRLSHADALSLALSRDGRRLAVGSRGLIIVYDAQSGEVIKQLPLHPREAGAPPPIVVALGFDSEARRVVFVSEEGELENQKVQIWDTISGGREQCAALDAVAVAFSQDDQCTGVSSDGSVVVLQVLGKGIDLHNTGLPVRRAVFDPNGRYLLAQPEPPNGRMQIIDLTGLATPAMNGQVEHPGRLRLVEPHGARSKSEVLDTTDGSSPLGIDASGQIVAVASSKDLHLQRILSGRLETSATLGGHEGLITAIVVQAQIGTIVTASTDGTVRIWRGPNRLFRAHDRAVAAIAFSLDGKQIATGSWDGTARVWDPDAGDCLSVLTGHAHRIVAVAFSPDGSRIATASWDRKVRIWHGRSGAPIGAFEAATKPLTSIAFSPDGRLLAAASDDGTVRLWDTQLFYETGTFEGHAGSVYAVAFSPDGRQVATGGQDGTARIWDMTDRRRPPLSLQGHKGWIRAATFSPDGVLLVTTADDGEAWVWKADTGACVWELSPGVRALRAAAISPDGRLLAVGGEDSVVWFWDLHALEAAPVRVLQAASPVQGLAFSADGKHLAVAGRAGVVELWEVLPIDLAGLVAYARELRLRELTLDERRRF